MASFCDRKCDIFSNSFPNCFPSAERYFQSKYLRLFVDIATATLMNCLVCLEKPIKHGLKRPYAGLLFQVLFAYYTRHRDSVALVQEIYRYIIPSLGHHNFVNRSADDIVSTDIISVKLMNVSIPSFDKTFPVRRFNLIEKILFTADIFFRLPPSIRT